MDRVLLTKQNVIDLLAWRDEHREAVRSLPAPLRAVMIQFTETDYRIKGLREGDRLRLYLGTRYDRLGYADLKIVGGVLVLERNKMETDTEGFQSVLTVYCSLMALMVYGERPICEPDTSKADDSPYKPLKRAQKRGVVNITYILQGKGNTLTAARKGSHASPSKAFSVRGHYRHYKSGKVVWIAEYRKGEGKAKNKLYRVGEITQ